MLILTRRLEEAIIIDHNIRVVVTRIGPDSIRLGIEAPDHVDVNRQDVESEILRAQGLDDPWARRCEGC